MVFDSTTDHLTLFASSAGGTLCGQASSKSDLDAAYVSLNDPNVRDRVCRSCLREWLSSFPAARRPSWASELAQTA